MEDRARTTSAAAGASRFELAPPRRFVLPAILLLLTEQPGYGYSLEKDLREFRFGHIDRPTVYRTLAQLEADGLVESWSEAPTAGQARRVYGVTPLGERVLRVWMSVIKEERDCLGRVLRRYQATGTVDAVLAEVEGGWAAALGFGWSPVATTAPAPRRLAPVDADRRSADAPTPPIRAPATDPGAARRRRAPLPPRPRSFGRDGRGALDGRPDQLRRPRCDRLGRGRRWPTVRSAPAPNPPRDWRSRSTGCARGTACTTPSCCVASAPGASRIVTLDLRDCVASGSENRYRLAGELTFHGVTRPVDGTVNVEVASERRLVVTGEQVFDIRDFDVPSPTVLMLRIYPDVRVRLHVEADLETR